MQDDRGRRPATGRRPSRSPIERPLELDGWLPSTFDEIHVGDLVCLKLMAAFDAGDGTPRMSHTPGKPFFAMRGGIGFIARVVGEDLDHDGALLIERTAWSHDADRRVIVPPVLTSLSRRDLDRRGAWAYRHRDEGPIDRSGRTGTKLLHDRLLKAAGGGADDEIVVDRLAGCLGPETTAGVKPKAVGRIRAAMMLRGEASFSETVYAQLVAMPPIVRPTSKPKASRSATRKGKAEDAEETAPQLLNEPTRDAILSLRWEMAGHWEALRDAIPSISKTGAAIALAAWQENKTGGRQVSYSRTATHYEGRSSPLYTFEKVKTGVDQLDSCGLLSDHFRQVAGGRGTQSSFRASDELVEIVDGILGPKPRLVPRRPSAAVLIRDATGAAMELPDTRAFHRQVQRVEGTNEDIRAADLSHGVGACYTRIYHETIRRGGRWYADGMSWQNLKKEVRACIRIDDEETVELDYVTAHATMIYADAGVPLPEDAYATPGWPRKLAKVAFLTMINAKTRKAAVYSLAYGSLIAMVGVMPGTQAAIDKAAELVDAVVIAHMPVARSFFSDAGAALMKRDADIASSVMWGLLRAGVTTLGVHDSFIVKASEADRLRAAMEEAANDAGVPSMRVGAA